jgi:hypothetical protein
MKTKNEHELLAIVQKYYENESFNVWMARLEEMRDEMLIRCAVEGHDIRAIPGVEGEICVRCGWQPSSPAAQEATHADLAG